MNVSYEDVKWVSELMGKDFTDPERKNVIQCMESCDVNACPGSGKTTTMAAKLVILSEKLTGTMTGICALSHTNAARVEIEKLANLYSDRLLRHPNFVGTIQVFVDKFLAIPAYIEEYGRRPIAIDDGLFSRMAKRHFPTLPVGAQKALNIRSGNAGCEILSNICYRFSDFQLISFTSGKETNLSFGTHTPTYRDVLRVKTRITDLGYLTYHDAFSFANRYIKKYPELATLISSRFSFLFIDEMQDTDQYQAELLKQYLMKIQLSKNLVIPIRQFMVKIMIMVNQYGILIANIP